MRWSIAKLFLLIFIIFQTYFQQMTLKSRIVWGLFLELPQRTGWIYEENYVF